MLAALSGDTLIQHDFFTSRIDIQHGHWTLRTERQPSRARDTAAGCPLPRCPRIPPAPTAPTRVRRAGVLSPNRVRLDRPAIAKPSLDISRNCPSIQIANQSNQSKCQSVQITSPICPSIRGPCHAFFSAQPPMPPPSFPSATHPFTRALSAVEGELFQGAGSSQPLGCSLLGMARHGLLHPLAPPRLAHDSAAAARPPTTSSLVLPRAHGRLHEHARGTPALPTHAGMSAPSRAFLSTRVGRRRCRRVCQRSQRRSYRRSNRRSRRRHIAHTVSPHVRRRCVQLATTPLNYRRRVAEGIRFQRQKG